MKKIRLHTSKDELVNWDDLTEREKAIYDAGNRIGCAKAVITLIMYAIAFAAIATMCN